MEKMRNSYRALEENTEGKAGHEDLDIGRRICQF
jgi:hypothetical protein